MIYCMSDIHGELDRFKAMLDLINFSSDDTLYIIGDVIDRHPGGVEILKIIKDTPNMFMLLGNHEQMCLDTLVPTVCMEADGYGKRMVESVHIEICSMYVRPLSETGSYIS